MDDAPKTVEINQRLIPIDDSRAFGYESDSSGNRVRVATAGFDYPDQEQDQDRNEQRREDLATVLVKLLAILADSKDLKADIELLISVAGLRLRDKSDSQIAAALGLTKQVFSARRIVMMKRLGITPPAHSKSATAKKTYKLTNKNKIRLTDD